MTDMDGGGFLAQGGYGCVFYPEVNCQGKDTNNKNFLSLISLLSKKFKPNLGIKFFLLSWKYKFHNFVLRFTALGLSILGRNT